MSIPSRPPTVHRWMSTLAWIQFEGARVRQVCHAPCPFWIDVDIAAKIAELGDDNFTLWDRREPCPTCGKPTHFMASPGPGTVFRPMLSRGPSWQELPIEAQMPRWFGLDHGRDDFGWPATPSRVEAYLTAWAKTEGRQFDLKGRPILTREEQALLTAAERADFLDGFRRAIGLEQARQRLAGIFQGERRP